LTANWLAYHDLPSGNRPKPDPKVASFDVYPLGPQSSAKARALSTEALDRWYHSARDAQEVLRYLDATAVESLERKHHGEILMLLATELYRRDHGTDPPTPEALVGPYLERLPD
jgi:hypothetical protein